MPHLTAPNPAVPNLGFPSPPRPDPTVPHLVKKRTGLKVVGGIVAGVVVFGLGVAAGSGGSRAAAPATVKTVTVAVPGPTQTVVETLTVQPTTTQPPGPKTQVTNGTFQVGSDIVAGRWKTDGPGAGSLGSCYWERERNDSGDFSAIIANDNISGPSSITVSAGEFVKFDGGCAWSHS